MTSYHFFDRFGRLLPKLSHKMPWRKTQTDSLKRTFQNVTEVTQGVRFEVISDVPIPGYQPQQSTSLVGSMFGFGGGPAAPSAAQMRPLLIVIELGPDFPMKAPRLLAPNERHRFIDPNSSVILPQAHPKLANWVPHNELGKLVWEIYKTTFTAEPPIPVGMEMSPASPLHRQPASPSQSYPYNSGNMNSGFGVQSSTIQSRPGNASPATSAAPAIPELDALSPEETQELLEDEEKFTNFVKTKLSHLRHSSTVLEELQSNIQKSIDHNVAKQQEIDEARAQTEQLSNELAALREVFNQHFTRQQQIQRRLAPDVLAEKLSQASSEAEQRSDAIAEAFLSEGGSDLKDFMSQFLAVRKQYHLRLIKREALLAVRQSQPSVSSVSGLPY